MTSPRQSEIVTRGLYRDLDAFQMIEDGRVMVCLGVRNHRMPEKYVSAAEVERLREAALAVLRAADVAYSPRWREWKNVARGAQGLRDSLSELEATLGDVS